MALRPFRRNRQPFLKGKTSRISSRGRHSLPEIHYLREQVESYLQRHGGLYAHWRMHTPDWNDGPCRRCFHVELGEPADPDCEVCFGTGFQNGYSKATIQWMAVVDDNETFDWGPFGFIRLSKGQSFAPATPRISPSDVLGQVLRDKDGHWKVTHHFVVDGRVDAQRVFDETTLYEPHTHDHLVSDPAVYGYRFQASLIPPSKDEALGRVEKRLGIDGAVWLADPREKGLR